MRNLTVVTPSNWLGELVRQSFLNKYSVQVTRSGINLNVFKPTTSDFGQWYALEGKTMVLPVASTWDKRKGYDDLVPLLRY